MCTNKKITTCQANNVDVKNILKKNCDFCNMTNQIANTCPTRTNLGSVIGGDDLVELLQDSCPFKFVEYEQWGNIFCENLDSSRIQYLKCRQLLSKTIQCTIKKTEC